MRKAQRYTKIATIVAGSIHIRMIRKKAKNRKRRGQTARGVGKKKSVSGAGHGS